MSRFTLDLNENVRGDKVIAARKALDEGKIPASNMEIARGLLRWARIAEESQNDFQ